MVADASEPVDVREPSREEREPVAMSVVVGILNDEDAVGPASVGGVGSGIGVGIVIVVGAGAASRVAAMVDGIAALKALGGLGGDS